MVRSRDNRNLRAQLLAHILWFVPAVAKIRGVRQIKLLGSMITEKKNPKDIDFLVVVEDDADLGHWLAWDVGYKGGLNRSDEVRISFLPMFKEIISVGLVTGESVDREYAFRVMH